MRPEFPYCYNCSYPIPFNHLDHFSCSCSTESFISYLSPPSFPCPLCNLPTHKNSNYLIPTVYKNQVFSLSEYNHFCNSSTTQFYLLNNFLFKINKSIHLHNHSVFLISHVYFNYSEIITNINKPHIIINKLLLPNTPNLPNKLKLFLLLS